MSEIEKEILYFKKYLEKYLVKTPEEKKIIHVLKKLKKLPITLDHLQETGIGKTVNSYRKHEGDIGPKAKELIQQWKALVPNDEDPSKPDEEPRDAHGPANLQDVERRNSHESTKSTDTREHSPDHSKASNEDKDMSYHLNHLDRHNDIDSANSSSSKKKHKRSKFDKSHSSPNLDCNELHKETYETSNKDFANKESVKKIHESECKNDKSKGNDKSSGERHSNRSHERISQSQSRANKTDKGQVVSHDNKSNHRKSESHSHDVKSHHESNKTHSSDKSKISSISDNKGQSDRKSHTRPADHNMDIKDSKYHRERSNHSSSDSYDKQSKSHKNGSKSSSDRLDHKISSSNNDKDKSHKSSTKSSQHRNEHHDETKKDKLEKNEIKNKPDERLNVTVPMETEESEAESLKASDSLTAKIEDFRVRFNGDLDILAEKRIDEVQHSEQGKKQENKATEISLKNNEKQVRFVPMDESDNESQKSQDNEGDNNGMSFEDMLLGMNSSDGINKHSSSKRKSSNDVHNNISKNRVSNSKEKQSSDSKKEGHDKHKSSSNKSSSDKHKHSSEKSKNSSNEKKSSDHRNSGDKHSRDNNKHSDQSDKSSHHSHSSSSKSNSKGSSSSRSKSHSSSTHHHSKAKDKHKHSSSSTTDSSRKRKSDTVLAIPKPNKEIKLSTTDIVGTLPEITPNYKPLPHLPLGFTSPHKKGEDIDDHMIAAKKQGRTAVYSGRRNVFLTAVPKLFDACLSVLTNNIEAATYNSGVGYVPYDILKPVVERCTPVQLYNIEDAHPSFVQDTNELWQKHCQKDFKNCELNSEECETWRELYLRKHEERENKLQKLTANIVKSRAQLQPVKKTVLAYVDGPAKAPRDVRRRQVMHGTAGPSKVDPLAKLSSHQKEGAPKPAKAPAPKMDTQRSPRKNTKTVAPMMMKTLKLMKNWKTHRK